MTKKNGNQPRAKSKAAKTTSKTDKVSKIKSTMLNTSQEEITASLVNVIKLVAKPAKKASFLNAEEKVIFAQSRTLIKQLQALIITAAGLAAIAKSNLSLTYQENLFSKLYPMALFSLNLDLLLIVLL